MGILPRSLEAAGSWRRPFLPFVSSTGWSQARMRGFRPCMEQGSSAADVWGQGGQDFLPVHQTAEK